MVGLASRAVIALSISRRIRPPAVLIDGCSNAMLHLGYAGESTFHS